MLPLILAGSISPASGGSALSQRVARRRGGHRHCQCHRHRHRHRVLNSFLQGRDPDADVRHARRRVRKRGPVLRCGCWRQCRRCRRCHCSRQQRRRERAGTL
ncbi:hypothetical protein R5R35_013103 [Gryllus longicercus]|uniref:Uncharacterized protein n=1 Tax=Gryllus longicercus TaxID=2509291 RepID=A0AAN9WVH9_9ORTH